MPGAAPSALPARLLRYKCRPMKCLFVLAAAVPPAFACGPAGATSSAWFDMEGASVRLVTSGQADAQGRLRGVLDIRLKPGWKTYWRDPGDAGVPPTIDVSASRNVVGAEIDFPPPQRHDEGDFQWAGYDYPVGLPVTFTLADATAQSAIDATVFLGVCETICVPVQARFTLDPASDPDDAADRMTVAAAFGAVPAPATTGFEARLAESSGETALIQADIKGDPSGADLFLAGEDGYAFLTPTRQERGGKLFFQVEVTRPDETPKGPGVRYTLVTDAGAVQGFLPYF